MSLANRTCWVVGGVGVIGRGVARALLRAGATVVVNSRSEERLERLAEDLDRPERLVTVRGSLLPGSAAKTVAETLSSRSLDHVVAHGAVRYWREAGVESRDETHSLVLAASAETLLQTVDDDEFRVRASHLASLHLSAARELVPRLRFSDAGVSSYTFVTGDGDGHPDGRRRRCPWSGLNAHHVWGLSAALRDGSGVAPSLRGVVVRELRVRLPVNRPTGERTADPRYAPLSEEVGTLCAGLAARAERADDDDGALLEIADRDTLETLLREYADARPQTTTTES